ncbi:hypothetical protein B4589_003475 [Halolamina sp. CBA1230]|uniref:hypothetical protein n=1 Tax=Halolamina sp. CBA1230 TaxID=1853690 RepID=UPI0009A1F711|nr:hypothetical protein [Halolamina sp. CBA1230]QKY19483.1 hypothetical protein B4589_003475 [Halolamina sp. CBA1230]
MHRRRLAVGLTTLAGVAAVAVGVWLPWIVINPEYPARFPRLYVSGMGYRIEGFDWWILGLVALGVGIGVAFSGRRDRVASVARGVTGLVVVLLTLLWAGDRGGLDCLYVPVVDLAFGASCRYAHGPGVFVTAFGGVLLILAGGYQFVTATGE